MKQKNVRLQLIKNKSFDKNLEENNLNSLKPVMYIRGHCVQRVRENTRSFICGKKTVSIHVQYFNEENEYYALN